MEEWDQEKGTENLVDVGLDNNMQDQRETETRNREPEVF